MLVGTLLATSSSDEQQPLSGSGCSRGLQDHTYYEISCDLHLDHKCNHSYSLELIASNSENSHKSGLCINITTSQLSLTTNITFLGYETLTIGGSKNQTTTIVCKDGQLAGITFGNITRLTLQRLAITNCGAVNMIQRRLNMSSAITILYGKNVAVEDLLVVNNTGIGLTIVDHQGGLVHIQSSKFMENKIRKDDGPMNSKAFAGGGVYVAFFSPDTPEPITFRFNGCIFERNTAHTQHYPYLYTNDLGHWVNGRGLGGGFGMYLERSSTNNINVTFINSSFIRNKAFLGGGLGMTMSRPRESQTRNISIMVIDCLFEENGCNSTASGGGMHVNFDTHSSSDLDSSQFVIQRVKFINNCALFGGGLYLYSEYKSSTDQAKNTVTIEKCLFERNKAHTGSAVDITPNVFQRLSSGILSTPTFKDCSFSNNTVTVNNQSHAQTTYGVGTVYINLYNIRFEGSNNFENNKGTGIHIVNGIIDMSQSSGKFFNNSGIRGGAIALIGESSLIVGPNRKYTFLNNSAVDKGGAIYVQMIDNHAITASKTCFIRYYDHNSKYTSDNEWNSTIIFDRNRALSGTGHTIFSTSIYSCQIVNTDKDNYKFLNTSEVFKERRITIKEDTILQGHQVATEGAIFLYNKAYQLQVIPGERFAHGVSIVDDFNNTAKVVLTASITKSPKFNVKLDTAFTSCVGEELILKGKPGEEAYLFLHTTTSRLSYTRLKVKLIECPPGFVYSEISLKCVCIAHEYTGLLTCNTTLFHTYISPGFWMGMQNDTKNKNISELVTSFCPLHFCSYNGTNTSELSIRLPRNHSLLNEAMCGSSRTGVACGSCVSGNTTYFHSPVYTCGPVTTLCKAGWLFYILSELVPVTVVFIAVLTLNISFTSGAVNGFILFSQLLSSLNIVASGIITLPPTLTSLTEGYKLIYGLLNLEFFQIESLSFCLWHDASALDMLVFKYVTIVYALLLVMTVIWFMSKCGGKCLGKWCRITTVKSSVVHGISAFLILCYSQCIRISLNLLNTYPLFVRDGSNLTVSRRTWLNGDIVYFSPGHLPYALPALFCLLVIGLLPPMLLLAYPLSNKVLTIFGLEESKVVNFISLKLRITSLKPLLDSFQGSFKDNMRFFAGLYFHYRWIALIVNIIPSDFDIIYTAMGIFIVIILMMHAVCQPYISRIHNIVDTLLFGNLALINAISFAHYHKFRTKAGKQVATDYNFIMLASLQLVLIYLPLFIMVIYIILMIFQLCCRKAGKGNSEWRRSIISLGRSYKNDNEEELPHRLIAGDVYYSKFEETERVSHATDNNDIIDTTY